MRSSFLLISHKRTGERWYNASLYSSYAASGSTLAFRDTPLLSKTQVHPMTQCLRLYSSSSPPSFSIYFDRMSFHCRCDRASVHIPNKLVAEKNTPLLRLSQILSVTISYPLLCPLASGFLSADRYRCELTSRNRMQPQTQHRGRHNSFGRGS
jgi:hypothetical protein